MLAPDAAVGARRGAAAATGTRRAGAEARRAAQRAGGAGADAGRGWPRGAREGARRGGAGAGGRGAGGAERRAGSLRDRATPGAGLLVSFAVPALGGEGRGGLGGRAGLGHLQREKEQRSGQPAPGRPATLAPPAPIARTHPVFSAPRRDRDPVLAPGHRIHGGSAGGLPRSAAEGNRRSRRAPALGAAGRLNTQRRTPSVLGRMPGSGAPGRPAFPHCLPARSLPADAFTETATSRAGALPPAAALLRERSIRGGCGEVHARRNLRYDGNLFPSVRFGSELQEILPKSRRSGSGRSLRALSANILPPGRAWRPRGPPSPVGAGLCPLPGPRRLRGGPRCFAVLLIDTADFPLFLEAGRRGWGEPCCFHRSYWLVASVQGFNGHDFTRVLIGRGKRAASPIVTSVSSPRVIVRVLI